MMDIKLHIILLLQLLLPSGKLMFFLCLNNYSNYN